MLNEPHWLHRSKNLAPFVAGPPARSLNLLVSREELRDEGPIELLAGLGRTRPLLNVLATSRGFGGAIEGAADQSTVTYRFKDGTVNEVYVYGDWWRRLSPEQIQETGLGQNALERRLFLANEASRRDWVDGLVIEFEEHLIKRWGNVWSRAPVLSTAQAVALAGLYLRCLGDYTLGWDGETSIRESTDRFYRIGGAGLLSGAQSWLAIAMREWDVTGDPALFELADAMVVRLGRALRARDYLQVRSRAPVVEDVWGDALYFFESLLICLQGSLDATARFLHHRYDLDGNPRSANWRHDAWWRRLDAAGAPVNEFDRDRIVRLDPLVAQLRNAVHGAVLSHELLQKGDAGDSPTFVSYGATGIAIEATLAARLAGAAAAEGGTSKWLAQSYQDGVALIDPWSYCERAVDAVAKALTSVVNAVNATLDADGSQGAGFNSIWVGTDELRATSTALLGIGNLPRC